MSDLYQFLVGVDTFLPLSESFPDCQQPDKERMLESAEQTLRDVVYLQPEGESVVRAVNVVVSCMREVCAAMVASYDHHLQLRGRGRPRFSVSKEQLLFLLEHGFTQSDIAKMMGCSSRTIRRRITDYGLEQCLTFSNIEFYI